MLIMQSMNVSEAINIFGSVKNLAKELGITVQAIYLWRGKVPLLRVYQIKEILAHRRAA